MESGNTTKTKQLNNLLVRAWRERWTDCQYGVNIKNVLPRGVNGDVYNLAECNLQHILIGTTGNMISMNYLRHSVATHLISHASVMSCISKYEHFDRIYAMILLLQYLDSVIENITCRYKSEEYLIVNATLSLIEWLVKLLVAHIEKLDLNGDFNPNQQRFLTFYSKVMEKFSKSEFLMGILYIAREDDRKRFLKLREMYSNMRKLLQNLQQIDDTIDMIAISLDRIIFINISSFEMKLFDDEKSTSYTHCIQPLLVIEVLLNPGHNTSYYVSRMKTMQLIKRIPNERLIYEIIRASFSSLCSFGESNQDIMWCAFTFYKVPEIIKQLNSIDEDVMNLSHKQEFVTAFENLMDDNALLDGIDAKCGCNIVENVLKEWSKQKLIEEIHTKRFITQRSLSWLLTQQFNVERREPSIINSIVGAEGALSGVLKTLGTDLNKIQDSFLGVLSQLILGDTFELILTIATVEGRLQTLISRLIQLNENCIQLPYDVSKSSVIRSVFDISFLMLTYIVQARGSDVILTGKCDTFFEKWVQQCMYEADKPKNSQTMVAACDKKAIDEIIQILVTPDTHLKNSKLPLQDICMNLPGVMFNLIIAWENESIPAADIKNILDNIKQSQLAFAVCSTSFIAAYCRSINKNEYLKPLNMIQQFLVPLKEEEMSTLAHANLRQALVLIINKMQNEIHPTPNIKMFSSKKLVSDRPLKEQFDEICNEILNSSMVSMRSAQSMEAIFLAGGPNWFATQLTDFVLKFKYNQDIEKILNFAFGLLHFDIELCTEALLKSVIPVTALNNEVTEKQSTLLARLSVYAIISAFELNSSLIQKKRARSQTNDDMDMATAVKLRKLNDNTDNTSFATEHSSETTISSNHTTNTNNEREKAKPNEILKSSLQYLFNMFQKIVKEEHFSHKLLFIYHFISVLVQCGGDRIHPILSLLPQNLLHNLLKVMDTDEIKMGLICRFYDVKNTLEKQAMISDMCLWHSLERRKTLKKLA